jgi:hypothetical protein
MSPQRLSRLAARRDNDFLVFGSLRTFSFFLFFAAPRCGARGPVEPRRSHERAGRRAPRPARGRERSAAGPAGTRGIRARGGGTDQLCSLYFPTLYQTAAIYYCFTVCRAPPLPHAAADVYTAIMVPNRKTTPTDCRGSVRSVECQRERSFVRRWPHLLVQPKGANVCPLSHL